MKHASKAVVTIPNHRAILSPRIMRSIVIAALFLQQAVHGAWITSTNTHSILGSVVNTKISFTPTNDVLIVNGGLSVGYTITTNVVNGGFTNWLDAGDYTVTFPLLPGRKSFAIAVPTGSGSYDITALMNPPRTYVWTNQLGISRQVIPGSGVTFVTNNPGQVTEQIEINVSSALSSFTNGTANDTTQTNMTLVDSSFSGDGIGLTNIPSAGIVGLSAGATNAGAYVSSATGSATNLSVNGNTTLRGILILGDAENSWYLDEGGDVSFSSVTIQSVSIANNNITTTGTNSSAYFIGNGAGITNLQSESLVGGLYYTNGVFRVTSNLHTDDTGIPADDEYTTGEYVRSLIPVSTVTYLSTNELAGASNFLGNTVYQFVPDAQEAVFSRTYTNLTNGMYFEASAVEMAAGETLSGLVVGLSYFSAYVTPPQAALRIKMEVYYSYDHGATWLGDWDSGVFSIAVTGVTNRYSFVTAPEPTLMLSNAIVMSVYKVLEVTAGAARQITIYGGNGFDSKFSYGTVSSALSPVFENGTANDTTQTNMTLVDSSVYGITKIYTNIEYTGNSPLIDAQKGTGLVLYGVTPHGGAPAINYANGGDALVLAGTANTNLTLSDGWVGSGGYNLMEMLGVDSVLCGGLRNKVGASESFLGSGYLNSMTGTRNGIVCGVQNVVSGDHSFIGSGASNSITSGNSAVLGGALNEVTANGAMVIGNFITNSNPYSVKIGFGSNASEISSNGMFTAIGFTGNGAGITNISPGYKEYVALIWQYAPAIFTEAPLRIGERYTITGYEDGDDFTNVGATNNNDGVVFIATGTTPAVWTNGSEITSDGAPISRELKNTLGDVVWEYVATGAYVLKKIGAFPVYKTIGWMGSFSFADGPGAGISEIYRENDDGIFIDTATDNIISGAPIEIRVYP